MSDVRIKKPLWIRITAYGFAAVLFASFAIGGLALYRQYDEGETSLNAALASDITYIRADLAAQGRSATALALGYAGEPDMADLLGKNNREEILRRFHGNMDRIRTEASLQSITFMTPSAHVVARIHAPDVFGDDVSGRRKMVVDALRTGTMRVGMEPGRQALSIFASVPVLAGDRVAGLVDVGTTLTPDYFSRLKTATDADLAVHLAHDGQFDTQNTTFAGNGILTPADLQAVLGGGVVHRMVETGGRALVAGGIPLVDATGSTIGVLEIASDVTRVAQARSTALWSAGLMTLAVCAVVLGAFLVFARRLGGAIGRLTATMERLAAGDLSATVASQDRADEIGAMARAVAVFKRAGLETLRIEAEAGET